MSLTRSIALSAALVLLGMGSAKAEMPAPDPVHALGLAEGAHRGTTEWIAKRRADEAAVCKTAICHQEFDTAVISALELNVAVTQYRVAEANPNTDITLLRKLYDKWGVVQARHEANARRLNRYYPSETTGARP